jgi:prepilin-type processing-associated H-X9-DG protein
MRLLSGPDQARWGGRVRRPGRRAAGMAATAIGLILVAGCQLPGTGSSTDSGASASGTVVAASGVADAPLYIGTKDGLFSRAGLTVKVISNLSVQQEMSAPHSGRVNIVFADYANMFYAQEQPSSAHLLTMADGYDAGPSVMEILTCPAHQSCRRNTCPAGRSGPPRPS